MSGCSVNLRGGCASNATTRSILRRSARAINATHSQDIVARAIRCRKTTAICGQSEENHLFEVVDCCETNVPGNRNPVIHIGRCGHTASTANDSRRNVWIRWKAGGDSAPSRRVATDISRPAMPVGVGVGASEVILGTLLNQCEDGLVIAERSSLDVDDVVHGHAGEVLDPQVTNDDVVICDE